VAPSGRVVLVAAELGQGTRRRNIGHHVAAQGNTLERTRHVATQNSASYTVGQLFQSIFLEVLERLRPLFGDLYVCVHLPASLRACLSARLPACVPACPCLPAPACLPACLPGMDGWMDGWIRALARAYVQSTQLVSRYTEHNVVISATHTHSGPGVRCADTEALTQMRTSVRACE
jgi:hypothetical protein